MDALDRKLIAAWGEVSPADQAEIIRAMANPSPVGAMVGKGFARHIKTSRGYVVFAGFVTGLARDLLEAVEFNSEPRT